MLTIEKAEELISKALRDKFPNHYTFISAGQQTVEGFGFLRVGRIVMWRYI